MRVGTRRERKRQFFSVRDHPHACGDKSYLYSLSLPLQGSSPCVWGQVNNETSLITYSRIIPMRVGTRNCLLVILLIIQDHPHACGDKFTVTGGDNMPKGSSPCVWGQVIGRKILISILGIIPMRVGTSCHCRCGCDTKWDHPHACGDKSITVADIVP